MSDSFHQQDSLNLVYSADQIYPPFLGYSMCFPEDRPGDVHLQIKNNSIRSLQNMNEYYYVLNIYETFYDNETISFLC